MLQLEKIQGQVRIVKELDTRRPRLGHLILQVADWWSTSPSSWQNLSRKQRG